MKNVYRIMALFLVVPLLVSSNFATATFSDVPSTHPNFDAINYVQEQGIVQGYPDGTFRPDSLINRAEFVKIIIEAVLAGQAGGSNCFPDAKAEWFAKYVCFARLKNFIDGYPDGTFKPANNVNFVESAKILTNVFGYNLQPGMPWYEPYVRKLAELKAIPLSISSFEQKLTRGEMAEMVYRLKAKITNKASKTYEELAGLPSHDMNMNMNHAANLNTNTAPSTNTNSTVGTVKEFEVDGQNYSFSPSMIKVKKGDTVKLTFKNIGGFHDFVVDEFAAATKRINSGQEETIQFVADKTGSFEYYCSVGSHRAMGMKGTLVVE